MGARNYLRSMNKGQYLNDALGTRCTVYKEQMLQITNRSLTFLDGEHGHSSDPDAYNIHHRKQEGDSTNLGEIKICSISIGHRSSFNQNRVCPTNARIYGRRQETS